MLAVLSAENLCPLASTSSWLSAKSDCGWSATFSTVSETRQYCPRGREPNVAVPTEESPHVRPVTSNSSRPSRTVARCSGAAACWPRTEACEPPPEADALTTPARTSVPTTATRRLRRWPGCTTGARSATGGRAGMRETLRADGQGAATGAAVADRLGGPRHGSCPAAGPIVWVGCAPVRL